MLSFPSLDILQQVILKQSVISISKKTSLFWDLYLSLQNIDTKGIIEVRERLLEVIKGISKLGCGTALNRLIISIYQIITKVLDKPIASSEVERLITEINCDQAEACNKLTNLQLIGSLFYYSSYGFNSIPIKLLLENFNKTLNVNEWFIKEASLHCLSLITKSGIDGVLVESNFLIKIASRFCTDVTCEVRHEAFRILYSLAQILRDDNLEISEKVLQSIFEIAVKGWEDDDSMIRKDASKIISKGIKFLFSNQTDEMKLNDPELKKKVKNELPRNLLQLISYCKNYFNEASLNRTRESIIECLGTIFESNQRVLFLTRPTLLAKQILVLISKPFENERSEWRKRNNVIWLLQKYCKLLNFNLQEELCYYSLQQIELLVGAKKNSRKINKVDELKIIILLETVKSIFYILGVKIQDSFPSIASLSDILFPRLSHNYSSGIRKCAIQTIKALSYTSAEWLSQMISLILNMTTIANAELACSKDANLFSESKSKAEYEENAFSIYQGLINSATTLALVLRYIKYPLKGIPLEISKSLKNTAIGLIIGHTFSENEEIIFQKYSFENQIDVVLSSIPSVELQLTFDSISFEKNDFDNSNLESIIALTKIRCEAIKALYLVISNLQESARVQYYEEQIVKCINLSINLICTYNSNYQSFFKEKGKYDYEIMQEKLCQILFLVPIEIVLQYINSLIPFLTNNIITIDAFTSLLEENLCSDEIYLIEREIKEGKYEICNNVISENAHLYEDTSDSINNSHDLISEWWDFHSSISELLSISIRLISKIICSTTIPMKTKEYIICLIEKELRSLSPIPEYLLRNFSLLAICISNIDFQTNNKFISSTLLTIILSLLSLCSLSSSIQTRLVSIEAGTKLRIGLGVQEKQMDRLMCELKDSLEKNESLSIGIKILEACSWIRNSIIEQSELEGLLAVIKSNTMSTSKILISHTIYIMMKYARINYEELNQNLIQLTYKCYLSDLRFEKAVTCASTRTLYHAINKEIILIYDPMLEYYIFDLIKVMNSKWKVVTISGIHLINACIIKGWTKYLGEFISFLKNLFESCCFAFSCEIIDSLIITINKGHYYIIQKSWPDFLISLIKKYHLITQHFNSENRYLLKEKFKFKFKFAIKSKSKDVNFLDDLTSKLSKDKSIYKYEYNYCIKKKIMNLIFFLIKIKFISFKDAFNLGISNFQISYSQIPFIYELSKLLYEKEKDNEKEKEKEKENGNTKILGVNTDTKFLIGKMIFLCIKMNSKEEYLDLIKNQNEILALSEIIVSNKSIKEKKVGLKIIRIFLKILKIEDFQNLFLSKLNRESICTLLLNTLDKSSHITIQGISIPIAKCVLKNIFIFEQEARLKILSQLYVHINAGYKEGSLIFSSDAELISIYLNKLILMIKIIDTYSKNNISMDLCDNLNRLNYSISNILKELNRHFLDKFRNNTKTVNICDSFSFPPFGINKLFNLFFTLIQYCSINSGSNKEVINSLDIDELFLVFFYYISNSVSLKDDNLYSDVRLKISTIQTWINIITIMNKIPSINVLDLQLHLLLFFLDYQIQELSEIIIEFIHKILKLISSDNIIVKLEKILIKALYIAFNKNKNKKTNCNLTIVSKCTEIWSEIIDIKVKINSTSLEDSYYTILISSELNTINYSNEVICLNLEFQQKTLKIMMRERKNEFLNLKLKIKLRLKIIIFEYLTIQKEKILDQNNNLTSEIKNKLIYSFYETALEIPANILFEKKKEKGLMNIYNAIFDILQIDKINPIVIQLLNNYQYKINEFIIVLLYRTFTILYSDNHPFENDDKKKVQETLHLFAALIKQNTILSVEWIHSFVFMILKKLMLENIYEEKTIIEILKSINSFNPQKFNQVLNTLDQQEKLRIQQLLIPPIN